MYKPTGLILIVDDNSNNLSVLSHTLKQIGLKVRMAMDGESAIKIAQQQFPEVILLDVEMPGINGFETCSRLKADASTQAIPVIFMTALADVDNKIKGFSLGAVDYITKPCEQQELIARVKVHLQMRQLTKALAEKNELLEQRITERTAELTKALQEVQQSQLQMLQSEKMSALGQLVAGIAHELNNPIGCIASNLAPAFEYVDELTQVIEFYQKNYPDSIDKLAAELEDIDIEFTLEDLPKLLHSMKVSTERIKEISIALRNFSRTDATIKMRTDIHDGIESSLTILRHRLKAVGDRPAIILIKEYGDLPEIDCYPGLLNQVFMNLIANAIDALEECLPPAPQIWIKTSLVDEQAIIQIADNGVGMSEEVQQMVFNQFFTTKAVGKGTGLGLSIVRQIVEDKHQGKLSFSSQVGKGTKFAITLPVS